MTSLYFCPMLDRMVFIYIYKWLFFVEKSGKSSSHHVGNLTFYHSLCKCLFSRGIFLKKFDPGKSHTFCPNSYLSSDRLLWMSLLFFHGSTIGRHYSGWHWSIERKRAHRINYFTLLYAFLGIKMDSTFFGSGIDATSSERRDKTNSSWVYNNLG